VTIKDARAKAAVFAREAEAGRHPVKALEQQAVGRDDTVERLVDTFMEEYAKPNLRSWRNAKSILNKHIVPAWGRQQVNSINERTVANLLGEIAKGETDTKTKKRTPRPGAAGEARKWGSTLYSWAVRSGKAARNPFDKSKNPVRLKPRQRFLDLAEARAVWQASCELDQPWRDLTQLLLMVPARMREIAQARWQWVDDAGARIIIPAEFYKTERPLLIAVPARANAILQGVPRWNEGDYIFSTTSGVRPVWGLPRKIMNKLHQRAETILGRQIEHFTVHDFRRTVRTHLSRLKVPEVVGELTLGHAPRGVAATYNVYDFETEKRDALEKWGEELTKCDL
jgi:integrase